ncbi:CynX/NimT family MFS transporter [Pseudomonadota bacterium]
MSDKSDSTQWGVVSIAMIAGVLVAMQVGKVPPAIPQIRESLGIGMVSAGWVASIFNLVGALIGIASGVFADRLGPRQAIIIGLMFLVAGGLLGAFSTTGLELIGSRTLSGFGIIAVVVACPRIIVIASRQYHHALVLGIWSAYMPVGIAIGMLFAAWSMEWLGWRGVWLVNAVVLVLFLISFIRLTIGFQVPAPSTVSNPPFLQTLRPIFASSGAWLLGAVFGCYSLQFFAVTAWLPTYFIENQQHSIGIAAFYTAIIVGCNAFGNLVASWWLHRGRPRITLLLTAFPVMAISAVGIFTPLVGDSLKIPFAFLFSIVAGLLPAAILAAAALHSPSQQQVGTVNGIIVQGSHIGTVSGPPLMAALVVASNGWQASWILVAISGLFGIAFSIMLYRVERSV